MFWESVLWEIETEAYFTCEELYFDEAWHLLLSELINLNNAKSRLICIVLSICMVAYKYIHVFLMVDPSEYYKGNKLGAQKSIKKFSFLIL